MEHTEKYTIRKWRNGRDDAGISIMYGGDDFCDFLTHQMKEAKATAHILNVHEALVEALEEALSALKVYRVDPWINREHEDIQLSTLVKQALALAKDRKVGG